MKYAVLLLTALLVPCCGGGSDNTSAPTPPPARKSRLVAFDAAGLDGGLTLPDFTAYWTLAEQRNGNSYPVKAGVEDEHVMLLRLDAKGAFATHDGKWTVESLPTIGRRMQSLGKKFWNEEKQASAAAIILFADAGAPYVELLKLCRELVSLQVRNLWLVTGDTRDGAARLLALKVDTDQLFREWYYLKPAEQDVTLKFASTRTEDKVFVSLTGLSAHFTPDSDENWQETLAVQAADEFPNATRIQFDLSKGARVTEFAEAANALAPVGYTDVEPFWPALDKPDDAETFKEKRKLIDFQDELEVAKNLDIPTLNEYWRAVSAGDRLPAPVELDRNAPMLGLRVATDGSLSTRARGEPDWTLHTDDMGFIQALQRNAGEIDFDTGASTLQLVMCVDRNANWETFLGVLEMMISAGVHRLYVVVYDVIGPTLRLLDLSLPTGSGLDDQKVAVVDLEREGSLADANYNLKFTLDGETREYSGARFASSLIVWTGERKSDPDALLVRLPRDEPFETLFTVLNGTAWLGMKSIRIGG